MAKPEPTDPVDPAAASQVSRRAVLRTGLLGTGLMLARQAQAQPASAEPPIPADTIPMGVRVGPGLRQHTGKDITVFWRGKLCIHARYCVTVGSQVFTPEGRWDLGKESADHIAHVVRQCPSGALTYERADGGPQELTPRVNVIRLFENGPLAVHADLALPGQRPMKRATLCRCGKSGNKPFCDGSHGVAGFLAPGEPPSTTQLDMPAHRGGELKVTPLRDGPYQVAGNLELCAGTGRAIARTASARLCRCGGSANPPFCDGTHLGNGFTADGA
jgi:CDGSH-type Zn-finger protein/uncharacterized Fe-S cluster protein YjdI